MCVYVYLCVFVYVYLCVCLCMCIFVCLFFSFASTYAIFTGYVSCSICISLWSCFDGNFISYLTFTLPPFHFFTFFLTFFLTFFSFLKHRLYFIVKWRSVLQDILLFLSIVVNFLVLVLHNNNSR